VGDVHRARPVSADLDRVLSIQTPRRVRNDGTVMHRSAFYQILEPVRSKTVLVEERLDGALVISHRGKRLQYQRVEPASRPALSQPVRRARAQARPASPPSTHPWKKRHAVPRPQ
jgi:hypothetical protein